MAVIDLICGWAFGLLRSEVRDGLTYKDYYISELSNEDILVLGSSRAAHHYVSQIIEDSLGFTCYNCGVAGGGIVPAYARFKMLTARHKPKMIIYEVTPEYDYLQDNGYSQYLGAVRPFSNKNEVQKVYLDFSDKLEKLRLMSSMYRNNACIVSIVKDILKPIHCYKGYEPLYGHYDGATTQNTSNGIAINVDSLKYAYFEKLILDCKKENILLVFMVSPCFNKNETMYKPAIALCEKHNILFFNYVTCDAIIENGVFFQDTSHLNDMGAITYTHYILPKLRELLNTAKSS